MLAAILWGYWMLSNVVSIEVKGNVETEKAKMREESGNMLQSRDGDIILGGILPLHKRESNEMCGVIRPGSVQAVETINMMIDQINKDDKILPGVKLGTILIDSCDTDIHTLRKMILNILPMVWNVSNNTGNAQNSAIFAGMMGAGGSTISIASTKVLQVFKVPQVSYWSTHPELSDKSLYKYFFRVVPSDRYQTRAITHLIKLYKWNFVSIVYESDHYGTKGFAEISEEANKHEICIAVSKQLPRNPQAEDYDKIVDALLEKSQAKAVILYVKDTDADRIFQAVYRNDKARNHFTFIGTEGWIERIPIDPKGNTYIESLNGSIGFLPVVSQVPGLDEYFTNIKLSQRPFKDRTANPWFSEYLSFALGCNIKGITSEFNKTCDPDSSFNSSTFTHFTSMQNVADTVLSFAHALNAVHKSMCGGKHGLCNEMRVLGGGNQIAERVYQQLKNISFTSINGKTLTFDANQDGPAIYSVIKYLSKDGINRGRQSQDWKQIGLYKNEEIIVNETFSSPEQSSSCSVPCKAGEYKVHDTEKCCWTCTPCSFFQYVALNGTSCEYCPPGEAPTSDRLSCEKLPVVSMEYATVPGIICLIIGVAGILLTLIAAAIYFKLRKTAIVKGSGQELCAIIFLGIFLTYLNAVFIKPSDVTCLIMRLLLAFGPTAMYSGLLVKSVRIMIIFRSQKLLGSKVKMFLQPIFQITMTCCLIGVQLFLAIVWFMQYPVQATYLTDEAQDSSYYVCTGMTGYSQFIAISYHILLLLICSVISTINRKVPSGFNETQFVVFSVYTTLITWFAYVTIIATNEKKFILRATIISICLSLNATMMLFCIFGYRCYTMVFHPEQNTQKNVMAPSIFATNSSGDIQNKSKQGVSSTAESEHRL